MLYEGNISVRYCARAMTSQHTIIEKPPVNESGEPSRDEVFSALSNRRRRHTIRYLKQVDAEARVRDIAEQIA
ncbi:hypothetical protein EXE53_25990, partial [Halorubrum sp. SD626R]